MPLFISFSLFPAVSPSTSHSDDLHVHWRSPCVRFVHNIDRNRDGLIQYSEFFDAMQNAERAEMPTARPRQKSGPEADAAFLLQHGMRRRNVVAENARVDQYGVPLALPASERTSAQKQYESLGHWGGLRGTSKAEDAVREHISVAQQRGAAAGGEADADFLRQLGMAKKRSGGRSTSAAPPPPPPARTNMDGRPPSTFGTSRPRTGKWLHMSPSKAHLAPKAQAPISPVFFDRAFRAESRKAGVADILG